MTKSIFDKKFLGNISQYKQCIMDKMFLSLAKDMDVEKTKEGLLQVSITCYKFKHALTSN